MSFDLPLRPFAFDGDGVTAVVSTRHGGVSTGPYDSLNLGGHVGDVPKAVAENRRRLAAALAILVADCAPIVLYDPVRRAVGVAHSGRVGTIRGVVRKTVETMTASFGSAPDNLLIGIGPAIGAASYEIGAAEVAAVRAAFGPELLTPSRPEHAMFDLTGAIRRQLDAAGVPRANVYDLATDTRKSTDDFFSDRAARPCGRFAAIARLNR